MGTRLGWGVFKRTTMSNIHKPHPHTYPYMWCSEKLPGIAEALHCIADVYLVIWISLLQLVQLYL